jgi:hypothetical protein
MSLKESERVVPMPSPYESSRKSYMLTPKLEFRGLSDAQQWHARDWCTVGFGRRALLGSRIWSFVPTVERSDLPRTNGNRGENRRHINAGRDCTMDRSRFDHSRHCVCLPFGKILADSDEASHGIRVTVFCSVMR